MVTASKVSALLAAAVTGAAALMGGSAMAADSSCLGLAPGKIGMQLYSVLTELRPPQPPVAPGAPRPPQPPLDPARLDSVLARLHTIGWRNIENFGGAGGLTDAQYKAAADRNQIQFVAGHENLADEGFAGVLARAKLFGQTYVGSGNYGQPGLDTLENVLATAAHLNELGRQAAAQGLKFYVHNHQVEFKNTFSYDLNGDGRPETVSAWEIVEAKTDPRYVNFEVDVHWAKVAMGVEKVDDLLNFLQKHRSRIVLLHIKDTAPDGKITDLGRGTTDWRKVMAAAGPQVGYYLWEFDGPPAPFQSAEIAYRYMTCARR